MKAFHETTYWFVCRLGCLTGDGPLATHSNWNVLDLISPSEWFTFFHLSLISNLWLFACCFYRVGERYSLLPQMEQSCMTFQWPYRHCCLVSLSSAQTTHSWCHALGCKCLALSSPPLQRLAAVSVRHGISSQGGWTKPQLPFCPN